jgi:aminopeptidase N
MKSNTLLSLVTLGLVALASGCASTKSTNDLPALRLDTVRISSKKPSQLTPPQQTFGATNLSASDDLPEQPTRNRTYDLLHTKLTLSFDWQAKAVNGVAEIKLVPFASGFRDVVLDAGDMKILSIEYYSVVAAKPVVIKKGNRVALAPPPAEFSPVAFDTAGEKLTIRPTRFYTPEDTLVFKITYRATPQNHGLFFIKPDTDNPKKPYQIWSQGEPEDNHFWFPTYDSPNDKMTTEIVVTVGDSMKTSSNGKLISSVKNADGTRTDHWLQDKPHSSYLVTLIVGDYRVVEDFWTNRNGKKIPVQYYVTPKNEKYARLIYGKTPDMIDYFSKKIGYDYAWDKYAQIAVTDFTAGGMENTSATTMYEWIEVDERANIDFPQTGLIAHELAHQWWGDLLTAKNWANLTLNEGFATYFVPVYLEHAYGLASAQEEFLNARTAYLNTVKHRSRPIVYYRFRNPNDVFDVFAYQKGGWVLNMLRHTLGDEGFWKSLNYYAHANEFKNVDMYDLQKAVEMATGQNLAYFFEQWYLKEGHPEFQITQSWNDADKVFSLHVRQQPTPPSRVPVFKMPIDVEFFGADGKQTTDKIFIEKLDSTYAFKLAAEPKAFIFDKGDWMLKTVSYPDRPKEAWYLILSQSDDMPARVEAVDSLKEYLYWDDAQTKPDADTKAALLAALKHDAYPLVRRTAINVLARLKNDDEVRKAFIAATTDKNSAVRNAAVFGLRGYHGADVTETLMGLIKSDSSFNVVGSSIFTLSLVDTANAYDLITPQLANDSYREIIRSAVLGAYGKLGDRRGLAAAVKYAKVGSSGFLRNSAIETLGKLATADDADAANVLADAAGDQNKFVSFQACRTLTTLKPKSALPRLKALLVAEPNFDRQRNLVKVIEAIEGDEKK